LTKYCEGCSKPATSKPSYVDVFNRALDKYFCDIRCFYFWTEKQSTPKKKPKTSDDVFSF